ncbi:Tat pathway signal protein [Streptomyces niveus]|uniref:Tat pathway signal protein n=1 Tax=Streptomyces niveus TaxID=193462 RepID=UPI0036A60061
MGRTRNTRLEAVIQELGVSQRQLAARFRSVAAEQGATELQSVAQPYIARWIAGASVEGRAPLILAETLSRGLGRVVTLAQIGLAPAGDGSGWDVDTVAALADLGENNMTMNRRQVLTTSAYSAVGAALPPAGWWDKTLEQAQGRSPVSPAPATAGHVEAVREATQFFSRQDQRLGGRAGRTALIAYLKTDVADYLARRLPSEQVRRALFSAASELVYLSGWMAFDSGDHGDAQKNFTLAFHMAAEADDAPLAGHILRAAAHQAVDLGHPKRALELAAGSVADRRYALASHRERALLGVVHARALAANQRKKEARAALHQAERDLRDAGSEEAPARVFFFSEASLAHETACTLRDLGDLESAQTEFKRSVRTRALPFARTHAVTLGYLGDVQVRQGQVEAACATWTEALDGIDGIQSGRVRDTVVQMSHALSPVHARGGRAAAELDQRARAVLRGIL